MAARAGKLTISPQYSIACYAATSDHLDAIATAYDFFLHWPIEAN
jgi:hypothetical protein